MSHQEEEMGHRYPQRRGQATRQPADVPRPAKAPDGMSEGTIKSLKRTEGYGFIADRVSGKDHFFHRSSLQATSALEWEDLQRDQIVRFRSVSGDKGLRAIEVLPLV